MVNGYISFNERCTKILNAAISNVISSQAGEIRVQFDNAFYEFDTIYNSNKSVIVSDLNFTINIATFRGSLTWTGVRSADTLLFVSSSFYYDGIHSMLISLNVDSKNEFIIAIV